MIAERHANFFSSKYELEGISTYYIVCALPTGCTRGILRCPPGACTHPLPDHEPTSPFADPLLLFIIIQIYIAQQRMDEVRIRGETE